ncbi:MAG: M20/M25/M40 family metallo-hydrolase, partial [Bacteroidia bacterium]|nr:M20/M25/M40 family metallo-hydrolase [Bacteroidia bacterium]
PKEAERIVKFLSADALRGRRVFTPDIEKAADFIVNEFKSIGLQTWNNNGSYQQEFSMILPKSISASAIIDGVAIDSDNIIVFTCQQHLKIDQSSGYEIASIKAGSSLILEGSEFINSGTNILVMVDESYSTVFSRLNRLKEILIKTEKNVIFILDNSAPKNFKIEARHEIREEKLANIVAVLPGKSRKNEFVIISGHYDHVGTGSPAEAYPHNNKDSIYNGANDDASGTAAVIMLAKYYKELNNNERTIVFVAFTAEELGGYGSQYFSSHMEAAQVVAMFNIEMIGTESKWGKNSAYITGYEKTDMATILQKNLEGTGFTFYPDPYPEQQLFYRSDNATLARLGVPAHTISTSKMDNEPNYHRVSDQIETLDLDNMAMIIKSIVISAETIIAGKEAPTRVKVDELH